MCHTVQSRILRRLQHQKVSLNKVGPIGNLTPLKRAHLALSKLVLQVPPMAKTPGTNRNGVDGLPALQLLRTMTQLLRRRSGTSGKVLLQLNQRHPPSPSRDRTGMYGRRHRRHPHPQALRHQHQLQ